jgi:arylamine N-acetyltransferase
MYTAIEMIPLENKFMERNLRQGGYLSQDAAERAVLQKGTGYVKHYESGQIVSVIMKSRLWIVDA